MLSRKKRIQEQGCVLLSNTTHGKRLELIQKPYNSTRKDDYSNQQKARRGKDSGVKTGGFTGVGRLPGVFISMH